MCGRQARIVEHRRTRVTMSAKGLMRRDIDTASAGTPSLATNAASSSPGEETARTWKPLALMYRTCPFKNVRDMGTVVTCMSRGEVTRRNCTPAAAASPTVVIDRSLIKFIESAYRCLHTSDSRQQTRRLLLSVTDARNSSCG